MYHVLAPRGPHQVSKEPLENARKLGGHSSFHVGHRNVTAWVKHFKFKFESKARSPLHPPQHQTHNFILLLFPHSVGWGLVSHHRHHHHHHHHCRLHHHHHHRRRHLIIDIIIIIIIIITIIIIIIILPEFFTHYQQFLNDLRKAVRFRKFFHFLSIFFSRKEICHFSLRWCFSAVATKIICTRLRYFRIKRKISLLRFE